MCCICGAPGLPSASWCGPCKELAKWLAGEPTNLAPKAQFDGIPALVASGDVYWVAVVFEDAVGNAADPAEAVAWAEAFPNPEVAVVADNDHQMYDYVYPGGFPSILVLEEDMTVRAYDRFDYDVALQSLLDGK